MTIDDHIQKLVGYASKLDALTNSEGKINQCVDEIVNNGRSSATAELCEILYGVLNSDNQQIVKTSLTIRDTLATFYGYQRILELCNSSRCNRNSEEHKELSLDELLLELNQLVGLKNVKSKVNDLIAYQKIQQLRKCKGLSIPRSTLHLAFTGNPGTGKTTVARIVGRIYKQIGLLSKGHFIEVSRTDLIAGYQGQTALKVKEVVERAKGGVLFIDEAYSITENDNSDSYGKECLTELTKALEDYREDLVVIVAGYTEPMKKFFESNPGLKSRFNNYIVFEDYDTNEIYEILVKMCKINDYIITDEALSMVHKILIDRMADNQCLFSNGRFARNMYEELVMNHSRRVFQIDNPSLIELKEIRESDVIQIQTGATSGQITY